MDIYIWDDEGTSKGSATLRTLYISLKLGDNEVRTAKQL
jgi:hypothetical protein